MNIRHEKRKMRLIEIENITHHKELLLEYHIKTGHGNINTLKNLLCNKYTWNDMNKDVNDSVKTCIISQRQLPRKDKEIIKLQEPMK